MAATLGSEDWAFWDSWTRAQRLLARALDRGLQRDFGISKAEFSVLVTLWRAPGHRMRVGELSASLAWEKSRVSHLLTRMEGRGFVAGVKGAASGRRTGIGLTGDGRRVVRDAIAGHGGNIRRHFLDPLTPDQAAALRAWSEQTIDHLDPPDGAPPG